MDATKKILFLVLMMLSTATHGADQPTATQLVDSMLERLGGRQVWAELKNTVNGSIQNRAGEPTHVYSVITIDFEQPRFKIENFTQDIYLVRVVDGQDNWRISWAGVVEDLPEDSFNADMIWYQTHIYKTIHRLAKSDTALTPKLVDGRLEIYEDGARLIWFKLDAKAEPYAFGFKEDDKGSLSGPWSLVQQGVHHPIWVSHADGTWRAAIKALEFNVPLHASLFSRPAPENLDSKSAE